MIITIVRKPFKGALIDNIRESQCGGLSIDLCRIPINEGSTGNGFNGRWPANFILNPKLANLLPAQAGGRWGKVKAKQPKSMFFGNHTDHDEKFKRDCEKFTGDVGPAARFFLQVKE